MSFVKITSDEIIAIKNRLNTEMKRRKYNGNLTSYGGSNYAFGTITAGITKIDKSYYNKIVTPLNAVKSTYQIIDDDEMKQISYSDVQAFDATLKVYENNKTFTSSTNDCGSACSGMCITACSTGCKNSCTGTCSGCSGTCSGGCSGCSGTCSGGCTGCSGGCSSDGCSSSCSSNGCKGDGCYTVPCFNDCTTSCWTGY